MEKELVFRKVNHIILLGLSILFLVFMSQGYIGDKLLGSVSGYSLISFDGSNAVSIIDSLSMVVSIILVCFMLITNILALLSDFGVIKVSKIDEIIKKINLSLCIILLCAVFVTLVCVHFEVSKFNGNDVVLNYKVDWAIILNFIISLIMFVQGILLYTSKKYFK